MTRRPTPEENWQDAFPAVEKVTPEQERVIAEVEKEIGRKPFVTLDPKDMSDGEDDEFPVLIWAMEKPWEPIMPDDEVERLTLVFEVEGDGTCHTGGNVGAASWKGLRDAYRSFAS